MKDLLETNADEGGSELNRINAANTFAFISEKGQKAETTML